MKKIFTILALLISVYCNGQYNYFVVAGQYNTNYSFRSSNTYSPGDTVGIKTMWEAGVPPADTTMMISFHLYTNTVGVIYNDTVLDQPWYKIKNSHRGIIFFVIPSNCPISQNIQFAQTYNPDAENNLFLSVTTSTTAAVLSPQELSQKNIQINVYTVTGQFVKQVSSLDYKTELNPGLYLFQSADEKYLYTGKINVN